MQAKKSILLLGFSLVEIMVASLLTALMGVLLMTSMDSSIKAKDTVEFISRRDQIVRQAMSRMAREISMAYLSKNMNAADPAYVTQFKGTKNQLFFSAFGHTVHQKDAKFSDQQVLGFYLAADKTGQQALMRRMRPNLNLNVEVDGIIQVLCPDVSKLEFSYFDGRMNKWDNSWVADPTGMALEEKTLSTNKKDLQPEQKLASTKLFRLPSFVRIKMTVKMSEDSEMTWITETEIVVQEPLDLH